MIVTINMPNIAEQKKYLGMSPRDQEIYIEQKIKEIVKINPNGISVPDISDKTPFSRQTIIKHLERMVACREAYKIKRRNLTTYYPNGKIVHPEYQESVEVDKGQSFKGTFLNNNFGEFVYIEDINGEGFSGGSMLINLKALDDFKELIIRLYKKKEMIENGTK